MPFIKVIFTQTKIMKRTIGFLLLAVVCMFYNSLFAQEISIVPAPLEITQGNGVFSLECINPPLSGPRKQGTAADCKNHDSENQHVGRPGADYGSNSMALPEKTLW